MGHKILLADDSITIQKVIELTFTDEDFELHTVGNGQKAIEEIRTVKPDIVLCDIIMPEKSGYEVCEHIKTSADLKHIPVLLLTGAFEPFDQERAKKAGCDGFLAKPFEPQTLISKVKELLKSTATAAPAATQASPAAPSLSSTIRTEATKPTPPAPPAPAPAQPAQEEAEDATVMMSPGMAPPMPLQAPIEPEPAADEGAGFQETLAEEAGQRALSVDADDRTMFLGPSDDTSGSGDDIWGEVQGGDAGSSSPEPYEEGQTVMMSAPIIPEPLSTETPGAGTDDDSKSADDFSGGFTELPSSDEPSSDDAWVIPGADPMAESAEPELTPLGDFGGFDDFSADPAKSSDVAEPVAPAPMPASPVFESKDADATAQPWGAPPAPLTPPAPPVAAKPASPEPIENMPNMPSPPKPLAPRAPSPAPTAMSGPEASFEKVTAEKADREAPAGDVDMDALADRVAKKVLSQLSEKVIQEIAWEVVPDLAESLIQKEIEEIKAKIPK